MAAINDIFWVNEPILPLIRHLADSFFPRGILSNTGPHHWDYIPFAYPNIWALFPSHRIASFAVHAMKPYPEMFKHALDEARRELPDLAPDQVLLIDDWKKTPRGCRFRFCRIHYQDDLPLCEELKVWRSRSRRGGGIIPIGFPSGLFPFSFFSSPYRAKKKGNEGSPKMTRQQMIRSRGRRGGFSFSSVKLHTHSQGEISRANRPEHPVMSSETHPLPDRDDLAFSYLEQLPHTPYPFQEEAILSWFDSDGGLLVCAPTGMGKTLIAEAGLYEALKLGKRAYYTTPLIALTEQKYREICESAERWGFGRGSVGLITGNRKENPDAPILVVVAEILFNRLLGSKVFATDNIENNTPRSGSSAMPESLSPFVSKTVTSEHRFNFDETSVVVMDEFHQFSDRDRGIVWEFTLGLLPAHVRTLLISATVGNAYEFVSWLRATTDRRLAFVRSDERKVPLEFRWIGTNSFQTFVEQCTGEPTKRMVRYSSLL